MCGQFLHTDVQAGFKLNLFDQLLSVSFAPKGSPLSGIALLKHTVAAKLVVGELFPFSATHQAEQIPIVGFSFFSLGYCFFSPFSA